MTDEQHIEIVKLTVRLSCPINNGYIGTGVVYYNEKMNNEFYVLTAAHCLYEGVNNFDKIRTQIQLEFFDFTQNSFISFIQPINQNLVSTSSTQDVAIIIVEKLKLGELINKLPIFEILKERAELSDFVVKGFSNATKSTEIVNLFPKFIQPIPNNFRFQLQLIEDYSAFNLEGFSGSGIFTIVNNQLYLYGILTRYTDEEKGKLFYCQYATDFNDILKRNFKPELEVGFIGNLGINFEFFRKNIEDAKVGLGPRFREDLNFKLPIAKLFNDIAKDNLFYSRFLNIIDKWVLESNNYHSKKIPEIEIIANEIEGIKSKIVLWAQEIRFSIETPIEYDWLKVELDNINTRTSEIRNKLYDMQREEIEKNKDNTKDYQHIRPYEYEISHIREIERKLYDFLNELVDDVCIPLANKPILILDGDAGNGKSHLFGDVATDRIKRKLPTLLLLGQKLNRQLDVWQNIFAELNLQCSVSEFLTSINGIGRQIGSRILILVDAINEGNGRDLWESRIANFINDFNNYPYVGVALSIRTTYKDYIIPQEVLNNKSITFKTHKGFLGNEYEALKMFCLHYHLEQPSFPIMSPEYTNPLFLHLICEGLNSTGERLFPKGSQGINKIYELYINSLQKKFSAKQQYKNRPDIILNSINAFSKKVYESDLNSISLEEANDLFETHFDKFDSLLTDLIEESILLKNVRRDYYSDESKQKEYVFFAFQRFGDFYIAKQLLEKYKNANEVKEAFKDNNEPGKLINNYYWNYQGVLEAFSTLLPELYSLELFEVYEWLNDSQDTYIREKTNFINNTVLNSLEWRSVESIDNKKITKWLNHTFKSNFHFDDVLYKFIQISSIQIHPFNADRLYKILSKFNMPHRDSFWQKHLRYYTGYDDNKIAFPLRRLIDWAWTSEVSSKTDNETARLVGKTLAWVLASTNKKLRDETTKAMVNLLEQKIDALIQILIAFKKNDDLYILERLYAVAYGCILRTNKHEDIKKLSQYIYNTIFKNGNVLNHVLIRDYARNSIEYGIYRKVGLKIDKEKITPPYKSIMPEVMPTKDDLGKYQLPVQENDKYDEKYPRMNNRIHFDVVKWDFGRKEVEPTLHNFEISKYTFEQDYKEFKKSCNKGLKDILKCIIENIELKNTIKNKEYFLSNHFGTAWIKNQLQEIEDFQNDFKNRFKAQDEIKYKFVENEIIPFFEKKYSNRNSYKEFNTKPILYWIVQRVFELGYNSLIHGEYDESIERHSYNRDGYIQRIGEKYQMIAYYEILAIITDNYKIKDGWSDIKKSDFYKGAWQLYIRDINPSFIKKNEDKEVNDDLGIINGYENWWDNVDYNYWQQPSVDWINNLDDLPKIKSILEKKDDEDMLWLPLKRFCEWKEPKKLGEERYGTQRKEIWYLIQAYFVKKSDKNKIVEWLSKQHFWNRWMPESEEHNSIINREKYWSPAYKDTSDKVEWVTIRDTKFNVMIANSESSGGFSNDNSGANGSFDIPCKTIFEALELEYSTNDGDFVTKSGELVSINRDKGGCLFRKSTLLEFLHQNELEIIWTVLGEKRAFSSNEEENYFNELSGVFYLEENTIVGDIKSFKRNDD